MAVEKDKREVLAAKEMGIRTNLTARTPYGQKSAPPQPHRKTNRLEPHQIDLVLAHPSVTTTTAPTDLKTNETATPQRQRYRGTRPDQLPPPRQQGNRRNQKDAISFRALPTTCPIASFSIGFV